MKENVSGCFFSEHSVYVRAHVFIYGVFINYATSLALASQFSFSLGLIASDLGLTLPWPR